MHSKGLEADQFHKVISQLAFYLFYQRGTAVTGQDWTRTHNTDRYSHWPEQMEETHIHTQFSADSLVIPLTFFLWVVPVVPPALVPSASLHSCTEWELMTHSVTLMGLSHWLLLWQPDQGCASVTDWPIEEYPPSPHTHTHARTHTHYRLTEWEICSIGNPQRRLSKLEWQSAMKCEDGKEFPLLYVFLIHMLPARSAGMS